MCVCVNMLSVCSRIAAVVQVGYDIGDTPETLLGAGSRGGQRRTAADDAQKQAHMLARLSSLRSRS